MTKPKSNKVQKIVIAVIALSFGLGLVLPQVLDLDQRKTASANSYSQSAIGHRAFVELLRRMGHGVERLTQVRQAQSLNGELLIFAEPPSTYIFDETFDDCADRLSAILLVLPKRLGRPDQSGQKITNSRLISEREVEYILQRFLPMATMLRADSLNFEIDTEWQGRLAGLEPKVDDLQLIRSVDLEPIISSDQGVLVGVTEYRECPFYILSDPDLMATHGLSQGDNAEICLGIVNDVARDSAGVLFDEVSHGFAFQENVWQALLRPPLLIATLHGFLALVLLLWATRGRLGKPLSSGPAIPPGKRYLIDNTVGLLRQGHYDRAMARQYLEQVLSAVAIAFHLNYDDLESRDQKLREIAANKNVPFPLDDWRLVLKRNSRQSNKSDRQIQRIARQTNAWQKEMLHGPGFHSRGSDDS